MSNVQALTPRKKDHSAKGPNSPSNCAVCSFAGTLRDSFHRVPVQGDARSISP